MAGVDRVLAGITLTASLLSLVGTAFILLCYLTIPLRQHVRHALIVNLTLADFINAANNSISGLWVLTTNTNLTDGPTCVANGFVGQLSVQAVDFSILAITVFTFKVVKTQRVIAEIGLWKTIGMCASAWVIPLITSLIALIKGWYHPVSGNWCWIQNSPTYLRYVLTHGWRFVIIFIVFGLCIYVQLSLRRRLRSKASLGLPSFSRSPYVQLDRPTALSLERLAKSETQAGGEDDENGINDVGLKTGPSCTKNDVLSAQKPTVPKTIPTPPPPPGKALPSPSPQHVSLSKRMMLKFSGKHIKTTTKQRKTSVEKTMLLNTYPIFYILLWLPGIANRIAEAMGHEVYALQVLQASTQLIGFANAITFGWNEKIGRHLVARLRAVAERRAEKKRSVME